MFYKYNDVNVCVCATNTHICYNKRNCEIKNVKTIFIITMNVI